jgi:hypothetical protein
MAKWSVILLLPGISCGMWLRPGIFRSWINLGNVRRRRRDLRLRRRECTPFQCGPNTRRLILILFTGIFVIVHA